MKVSFLYTLASNQALFSPYIATLQEAQISHHVNEQLLIDARDMSSPAQEAQVTQDVHFALLQIMQQESPDKIICTCSTIGGMAEQFGSIVLRVDRPMAMYAVQYRTIHVLAALESTLQPTKDLLDECARKKQVSPHIFMTVVDDAWSKFQQGTGYAETIANYIVREFKNTGPTDEVVIVLAQASMSPAANLVEKQSTGMQLPKILTSPAVCMDFLAENYKNTPKNK